MQSTNWYVRVCCVLTATAMHWFMLTETQHRENKVMIVYFVLTSTEYDSPCIDLIS